MLSILSLLPTQGSKIRAAKGLPPTWTPTANRRKEERWIVAAEEALPWKPGTFIKAYRLNQKEMIAKAVDDNAFPAAVRDLTQQFGVWTGTPTELLKRLSSK